MYSQIQKVNKYFSPNRKQINPSVNYRKSIKATYYILHKPFSTQLISINYIYTQRLRFPRRTFLFFFNFSFKNRKSDSIFTHVKIPVEIFFTIAAIPPEMTVYIFCVCMCIGW